MSETRTIGVDTMAGERRSDLKDSDDRKAILNSSGQLPKVDTKGIIPDLGEEVAPDHTEIAVDSEADRIIEEFPLHRTIEAPTPELAPGIEKSRQKNQRVNW